MIGGPSLVLASAAGFVSFVSPCVLPLVPGYLAVCGARPGVATARSRVLARAGLFIATFTLVFVILGLTATALGHWLLARRQVLDLVAGITIVVLGALLLAGVFVARLNRDWRLRGLAERAGSGGPVVAGAAFALAWTPCIGPTLGAILGLAATSSQTGEGAVLLLVYSAGLAIPFLLVALLFERAQRGLAFFRRHHRTVQLASGALLVAVGVLVLTGEMFQINIQAQELLSRLGLNFFGSI